MYRQLRAASIAALTMLGLSVQWVYAAEPDSTRVVENEEKYGVVVSATRTRRDPAEVPNASSVVKGETLRQRGARTLADALQDVVGMDTGDGSDGGSRLPKIGVWGLTEFDALLVSLDGVPVGGPFNPSLAQIPIEDVERIEIVNGPQGTMYGLSAFAGMVQVFTRSHQPGLEVTQRVSSFDGVDGGFAWNGDFPDGTGVRLTGSAGRGDGWQDRTDFTRFRGTASFSRSVGRGQAGLQLTGLEDRQAWGTPVPYENGEAVPGFEPHRNLGVLGARANHLVFGGTASLAWPLSSATRLEGTLGVTSDKQDLVRDFPDVSSISGDTVDVDGQNIAPHETSFYVDLRGIHNLSWSGAHELVGGAAWTRGKSNAHGNEFDARIPGLPVPIPPSLISIPMQEELEFEDERSYFGFYAHDTWTLHPRVTIGGGARLDLADEDLEAGAPDSPAGVTKDKREDTGWSGDGSVLFHLLAPAAEHGNLVNLYANIRRNFKPAAPNLLEPEGAKILEPERSLAYEGGLKSRGMDGQVEFDFSIFQMDLENQVVSTIGPSGAPELENAGHTRFRGQEYRLRLMPAAARGLSLEAGYAHHDPRFVDFTFTTPDSQSHDVSGNLIELAPQELWNAGASWQNRRGLSVFVSARGQGKRALTRRNTFFTEAWSTWDAGVGVPAGPLMLRVTGRNLSDSRHVTGESEIGDSQFYTSPPRRFTAEVSVRI